MKYWITLPCYLAMGLTLSYLPLYQFLSAVAIMGICDALSFVGATFWKDK